MTWMITAGGVAFDLVNVDSDAVNILDIGHHLSTINRFAGAAKRPYSVAEHSLLVCDIAERELGMRDPAALLAALMHDAHEAYFGDITSPVKHELGAPAVVVEGRLERAVHRRYGLITPSRAYSQEIRRADLMALATERRDLSTPNPRPWAVLTGIEPVGWVNLNDQDKFDWKDWRKAFIDRFGELNFARVAHGRIHGITTDEEASRAH